MALETRTERPVALVAAANALVALRLRAAGAPDALGGS
jgi:hypothetical protein